MKKIVVFSLFIFASISLRAEGLFLGLQYSFIDADLEDKSINYKEDDHLEAYNFIMGYTLNNNLAFEIFWGEQGTNDSTELDFEIESMTGANILGILPVADFLDLYGKLGIADIHFDNSNGDETLTDFLYGLGVSINVIEQFSIKLEYLQYQSGDYDNYTTDIDLKTFNFGFYLNL